MSERCWSRPGRVSFDRLPCLVSLTKSSQVSLNLFLDHYFSSCSPSSSAKHNKWSKYHHCAAYETICLPNLQIPDLLDDLGLERYQDALWHHKARPSWNHSNWRKQRRRFYGFCGVQEQQHNRTSLSDTQSSHRSLWLCGSNPFLARRGFTFTSLPHVFGWGLFSALSYGHPNKVALCLRHVSPRPARSSPAPSGCRPVCSTGSASPDRWEMATAGWRSHAPRSAAWRRPAGPRDGTGRAWPASCPAAAGSGWHCRPRRSGWASLCHPGRWPHPTKKHREGHMKRNRQRWTAGRNRDMPGFTFRRVNRRETGGL